MKTKPTILIVDDEVNICRILQMAFEKSGFIASTAHDVESALSEIQANNFQCVLTDVTMPGRTGYDLLDEVRRLRPDLPVIIMTAFGTIPQAVQAMRAGAYEYVTKPFDLDALKRIVNAAVAEGAPSPVHSGRKAVAHDGFAAVAESPAMVDVFDTVRQVADSKATVLITGESGVGKEVVAKALHHYATRCKQPFVAVSCAALPETLLESELFGHEKGAFTGASGSKMGRFELANQGTLFLDEIGEVPLAIQVKLLRVLQEREFERLGAQKPTKVDVRLVTATNRDLRQAVEAGDFRLDLLYRLQVVEILVPALRERREDILPLSQFFLQKYCAENGRPDLPLSESALELMSRYDWPGNVRELENVIERAVVLSTEDTTQVFPKHLPLAIQRLSAA